MRTRNTPKSSPAGRPKRTPAAQKGAAKAQTAPSYAEIKVDSFPTETAMMTPEAVEPKRDSSGTQQEEAVSIPQPGPSVVAKPVSGKKVVKRIVRKVIRKVVGAPKAASSCTEASRAVEKTDIELTTEEKALDNIKNTEACNDEPVTEKISLSRDINTSLLDDENIDNLGKNSKEEEEAGATEKNLIESSGQLFETVESMVTDAKPVDTQELSVTIEKEELEEEKEDQIKKIDKEESKGKTIEVEDASGEAKQDNVSVEEREGEKIEALSGHEVHEEFEGEDLADDDAPENELEAETLEEEQVHLNDAAKERKIIKEREIFVGGLDLDTEEEHVRKVFKHAGEVLEVRMHVDSSISKNKGYAFVQFATKEQASRALSEMKNPVINGKRCGTAPSQDNVTLFLGNICNTWTKEAIKKKLTDYGLEGVENINLVADPRHEGLSRGFAFVEFISHNEAMLAYKRLQKPDVVFGHAERTAKVAFSEPLREPDPEVMAQVKSVFIDGLPPNWDEDRVRDKFRVFGEIVRIMLARNMSTAKRKDFGFVDFNTHEAAVSCVEGVNKGLNDGNTKVKVKARLSNPLPKMQAVKGGMCGGFRIGHGSSSKHQRLSERGSGRGGRSFNRYSRGFHPRGPGRAGRMSFSNEPEFDYPPFQGRPNFERVTDGGWSFRGAHQGPLSVGPPYPDRARHGVTDRGYGDYGSHSHRRYPYSYEEEYDRSYMGRHFDDPYSYDDVSHGIKRPHYMIDDDPSLAESRRYRSRLDQADPVGPFRRPRYRGDLGADGGLYHQNYYGPRHGGSSYATYYGDDHMYERGYYY